MINLPILIILLTAVTSFIAFNNQKFFDRGKFDVGAILQGKQFDRLLTSGFLHADIMHLFFNMFTLYFFSNTIIANLGKIDYLIIYLGAILTGNLLSLWMYRRNYYYTAIGASGGVSGIVFAAIALNPFSKIMIFPIPFFIEGWIFGIIYLAYSVYGMKSQLGNIGHAAHLGGAAFGLILAIILLPDILKANGLYIGIMIIPLVILGYFAYKEK